jgi:uncharacterized protein YndB with AHSA1/START domain
MTQVASPNTLVMRHTFKAPRAKVFEAWTTAEGLRQFLCPGDFTVPEIQVDARVGGSYRIKMLDPKDGESVVVGGTYKEIRKPERIVCTWKWDEDDTSLERETILTLDFLDRGNETELVLTHENFRDAAQRDRHEHGWGGCFAKLDGVLAK